MISLWSTKVPKSTDIWPVGGRATQTQGTRPCGDTGRDWTPAATSQGKPHSVESLETRGGMDQTLPQSLHRDSTLLTP